MTYIFLFISYRCFTTFRLILNSALRFFTFLYFALRKRDSKISRFLISNQRTRSKLLQLIFILDDAAKISIDKIYLKLKESGKDKKVFFHHEDVVSEPTIIFPSLESATEVSYERLNKLLEEF